MSKKPATTAVQLSIQMRPTGAIKPYEKNPRHNEQAVEAVAASIREFGFRQPIVVDADGVIICGHTRWKAAQRLGLERVPVHVATDLTPEQVRAYRLADNATGELAEWDYGLLGVELADLEGLGVDLGVIGLGDDVLADLSRQANAAQADANAVEVPAPDPRIAINIRVPAAIWLSKREEMRRLFDQIARTYQAKVQIDE